MFKKKCCCLGTSKLENTFSNKTWNRILSVILLIDVIGIIIVCYLNKGIIFG
jgi:hypothetical protein